MTGLIKKKSGCMFYHFPLTQVAPDGQSLVWFEQRWNKIANIIFMESPQCVGFSYNDEGNCTSGDDQVRHKHNCQHEFLISFL